METTNYKVWPMLKKMIKLQFKEQPIQLPRIIIYSIASGLYPFMAIILPKLALGIVENANDTTVSTLIKYMAIYVVVAGLVAFLSGLLTQMISSTNMRIRLRYISWMSEKTQTMEYRYVEDAKFNEKYAKAFEACEGNNNGVEGVYNKLYRLPGMILAIAGMSVMVILLNPLLLVALLLHVIVTIWTKKKAHDYKYSKKEEIGHASRKMKYYRNTTNDFNFGKDIRIFNLRERILSNYRNEINAYTVLAKNVAKKEWLYSVFAMITMFITFVSMYGILIYKCYYGMPISSFTMYVFLVSALMDMMVKFADELAYIRNEGQYVDDFYKFMDLNLINEGDIAEVPTNVEIVFDKVSFKYPNTEKYIYKDFSFTIHAGERLAIVGVNGAGKTTLVKLMCGLYQPTEGHIYINGKDILEYKKETLYKMFGTVFQDFSILAFPIKQNVSATSEGTDEERVKAVLESVGLGKKIRSLPKGIDQMMLKITDDEGVDLSGGERQKLAIARALYKDAPMVIMDEPTAALDALAEADIYENFSSLVQGKTAVYISHRLASTKFCDKIALFDSEGIKEYGTHDELMEKKGMYYEMFLVQGKYYQEDAIA